MRASIILALFCVASLAAAETLGSARLRREVPQDQELNDPEFVEMTKTSFGSNLINMLSLKFHAAGGKLQTVLDLLDQLATKIKTEQSSDTKEYTTELNRLNSIIKTSEAKIAKDQKDLAAARKALKKAKAELKEKEILLITYQKELKERKADLAKATSIRKSEHQAYLNRKSVQESVIAGIGIVKDILKKVLGNKEVNQTDLTYIFNQLDDLKATLKASLVSDAAAEAKAQANYEHYKLLEETRITLLEKNRIPKTKARIAELKEEIKKLDAEIISLLDDIKQNRKVIAEAEKAIKTLKANYKRNTETRSEQLALIKAVKARLTGNSKNVQKYLNAA